MSFFALTLLIAACAEPPAKEMHQAQGAIDAARAAGAEEYAADELKLAVDGLAKYQEAVAARDYRLALAHALDSRERAQNAAKTAVDGRAKARGDAERQLAEAVALVQRAEARLRDTEVAKLPRRTLAPIEDGHRRDVGVTARSARGVEEGRIRSGREADCRRDATDSGHFGRDRRRNEAARQGSPPLVRCQHRAEPEGSLVARTRSF